jgi:hypothetical protein
MNTLTYADTNDQESSAASSIASTMQQMSISFGVATAGLATAFFVPGNGQGNSAAMIHGIHKALVALGALTILSTIVFRSAEARRWRRREPRKSPASRRLKTGLRHGYTGCKNSPGHN